MLNQQKLNLRNKSTGSKGEQLAAAYLQSNDYLILSRNFTMHWGELDIVAQKNNTIVFVEVKTRVGFLKGNPYENVHYAKLKHLMRSAQFYIQKYDLSEYKHRIDVISIVLSRTDTLLELNHFENVTE